jgi:hypothetical protein
MITNTFKHVCLRHNNFRVYMVHKLKRDTDLYLRFSMFVLSCVGTSLAKGRHTLVNVKGEVIPVLN